VFKPTAANLAVILARLSVGAGMEALAPDWFAIRPSLLPSRTFHEGPPDCKYIYIIMTIHTSFFMYQTMV
jgi:hypothetical protein